MLIAVARPRAISKHLHPARLLFILLAFLFCFCLPFLHGHRPGRAATLTNPLSILANIPPVGVSSAIFHFPFSLVPLSTRFLLPSGLRNFSLPCQLTHKRKPGSSLLISPSPSRCRRSNSCLTPFLFLFSLLFFFFRSRRYPPSPARVDTSSALLFRPFVFSSRFVLGGRPSVVPACFTREASSKASVCCPGVPRQFELVRRDKIIGLCSNYEPVIFNSLNWLFDILFYFPDTCDDHLSIPHAVRLPPIDLLTRVYIQRLPRALGCCKTVEFLNIFILRPRLNLFFKLPIWTRQS